MKNLYELHSNVIKFEPATFEWQFALSASLVSSKHEEEEEQNESNEKVVVKVTKQPRARRTLLDEKPIMIDSLPVAPGLTVITADTEGGKTVTAIQIVNLLAERGVKAGWVTLQETAKISTFFSSLGHVADAFFAAKELSDVIVIDSFRLTQFGISGGATRAGGVSSKLFELLTELNSAAEVAGIALIVLFNPLAKDEAAAETLNRDVASSVNTVITLRELGVGELTSRLTDDRRSVSFSINNATVKGKRGAASDKLNVAAAEAPKSPYSTQDFF